METRCLPGRWPQSLAGTWSSRCTAAAPAAASSRTASAGSPQPVYSPPQPKINPPLVKALARAHRWKKQLDTKQYATIKEIAAAEKVAERYVGQLLKLTLLAPDIVEMILDGRLPKGVGLADFMKPWPGIWEEQRERLRALGHESRPG